MPLVDHLQDLTVALRRPKLKSLAIPLSGITFEFCLVLNHVLNFETLQSLDISSNWFGLLGLAKLLNSFQKFKALAKLNLNNNKLCYDEERDLRPFADVITAVSSNLRELKIAENSINCTDMVMHLAPAIQMCH